jgi:hypothetical protein
LGQYNNIMQRILLVYKLYVGAYFVIFERRLQLRLYRRLRLRGPYLDGVAGAAEVFGWAAQSVLWRWLYVRMADSPAGSAPGTAPRLVAALLQRLRLLVLCG